MKTWLSLAVLLVATPAVAAGGNGLSGGGSNGGGGPTQAATNATDGQATSTANQQSLDFNMIYNGTTWDRLRGTAGAANVGVTTSIPEGGIADAAYGGSGSCTIISCLKGLYAQAIQYGSLGSPSTSVLSITQPPLAPLPGSALESCHVFRSAATNVHGLDVTIGATAGWVMIFDATTAPSNGAVTPKKWFPVGSNGTFGAYSGDFSGTPLLMSTGFVACFSSTGPFTFTGSTTAAFNAQAS